MAHQTFEQNDAAPATSRYLVLGDLNTSVDSEGYLKWIDGQYIEHNVCMAPDWVTSQSGLTMWLRTAIEYNNIHRYMTLPSGSKGGFLASRKFHIIHVKSNSSLKEALVVQAGRMPALGLRANTQAYQPEQRTAWGDSPHRPSPGTSAYAANTTRLRRPPSDLETSGQPGMQQGRTPERRLMDRAEDMGNGRRSNNSRPVVPFSEASLGHATYSDSGDEGYIAPVSTRRQPLPANRETRSAQRPVDQHRLPSSYSPTRPAVTAQPRLQGFRPQQQRATASPDNVEIERRRPNTSRSSTPLSEAALSDATFSESESDGYGPPVAPRRRHTRDLPSRQNQPSSRPPQYVRRRSVTAQDSRVSAHGLQYQSQSPQGPFHGRVMIDESHAVSAHPISRGTRPSRALQVHTTRPRLPPQQQQQQMYWRW